MVIIRDEYINKLKEAMGGGDIKVITGWSLIKEVLRIQESDCIVW